MNEEVSNYTTGYTYPPSHNHGSVENGCISNIRFLSFRGPIFHETMIMGERVFLETTLLHSRIPSIPLYRIQP